MTPPLKELQGLPSNGFAPPHGPPREVRGDRWHAVVARGVVSLAAGAGLSDLLWRQVPQHLSIKTDIVGYPIFYGFNYRRYIDGYYVIAFIFPILVAAIYMVIGRFGPLRVRRRETRGLFPLRTGGGEGSVEPGQADERAREAEGGRAADAMTATDAGEGGEHRVGSAEVEGVSARHRGGLSIAHELIWAAVRIALPAFAVAAEISTATDLHSSEMSWAGGVAGLGYVAGVVAGAAGLKAMAVHRRGRGGRHRRSGSTGAPSAAVALSRANSLLALSVIPLLYWLSKSTNLTIRTTNKVVHYPWLPLWLVVVLTVAALWWWVRASRRRGTEGRDAREAAVLVWVVGPVLLFLAFAVLPGAYGTFQAFDDAQYLAGPQLVFAHGLLPWKGVYLLHGILGDVVDGAIGMVLFGHTRWGGDAGIAMVVNPLTWLAFYAFAAYFLRRNRVALFGIGVAIATGFFQGGIGKFLLVPLFFIVLDRMLRRPTWGWCALFAFTLFAASILTPEVGVLAVCLLGLVPIFEAASRRRGSPIAASFPRTIRVAVAGAVLLAGWVVWLAAVGALGAFIDYYVIFTPGHALWGAYPVQWPMNSYFMTTAEFFLPVILWLLTAWWVVYKIRRRRSWQFADWSLVGAALCSAVYFPQALNRADFGHVIMAFSVASPLLVLWLAKALDGGDRLFARLMRGARGTAGARRRFGAWSVRSWLPPVGHGITLLSLGAVLALTSTGVGAIAGTPISLAQSVPARFHATSSLPAPAEPARLGYTLPDAVDVATINELGAILDHYAGTSAPVFTFANQLGITYYLLNRTPGTRFFHVEMAQTLTAQHEVIAELKASRPPVTVFSDPTFGLPSYDGVPQAVRAYLVSQYILDHYRPIVDVDGELIYLRDNLAVGTLPPLPPGSSTSGLYFATPTCNFGDVPNFLSTPVGLPARAATKVPVHTAGHIGSVLAGWAVDPSTDAPAPAVVVVAGGQVVARATPSAPRPDVVEALHQAAALDSGFSVQLPADVTGPVELYAELGSGELVALTPVGTLPRSVVEIATGAGPISDGGVLHPVGSGNAGYVDHYAPSHDTVYRLPAGSSRSYSGYHWIEVSARAPLGRSTFALTDEPGGSVSHEIAFNTLPLIGRTVLVQVGSCPQWHGYDRSSPLYLLHTGHRLPGLSIRLLR